MLAKLSEALMTSVCPISLCVLRQNRLPIFGTISGFVGNRASASGGSQAGRRGEVSNILMFTMIELTEENLAPLAHE